MNLGIVSNCWKTQLAQGLSLDALIAEALRRGYSAIELRQGFLGRYETPDQNVPIASLLEKLPAQFPQAHLNLAIQYPFLNGETSRPDALFDAALSGAAAIAGEGPPHLRLVDLTTSVTNEHAATEAAASGLADLARKLVAVDGVLAVENARQPWNWFWHVFQEAQTLLQRDADRLKLCFDPVNLFLPTDDVDPVAVASSLPSKAISMVHFKQRVDGQIATAVCDGDADWAELNSAITKIGYDGAFLFEVASHKKLWEYLDGSREYLRRRGWIIARPD